MEVFNFFASIFVSFFPYRREQELIAQIQIEKQRAIVEQV